MYISLIEIAETSTHKPDISVIKDGSFLRMYILLIGIVKTSHLAWFHNLFEQIIPFVSF